MSKLINLEKEKIGRLLVIRRVPNKGKHVMWECVCECGNRVIVSSTHLRSGHTSSCGCLARELTSKRSKHNLQGNRFGRLEVLKFSHTKNKRTYWECLCDCGGKAVVYSGHLKNGHTKSCGCLFTEKMAGETHPMWKSEKNSALKSVLLSFINSMIKNKTTGIEETVGYTKSDFVRHIESKFSDGMSWGNYGKWHVDYIKPLQYFFENGITDPKIINALDNLQPLWAEDNIRKSDRIYSYTWEDFERDIYEVAEKFKNEKISAIFGIPRGGVIPAIKLSHLMNIPVIIEQSLPYINSKDRLLIVDDIYDTGLTLNKTIVDCSVFTKNLLIFCLCVRRESIDSVVSSGVLYGQVVDNGRWIHFPWESMKNSIKEEKIYRKSLSGMA